MHPQQQKRTRSSRPKLFQCTGFGDCNMVFTRSEHLARHSRKHTGEKPFVCIIPQCTKSFSRFDNMMQHTQTHRNGYSIVTASQSKEQAGQRSTRQASQQPIKKAAEQPTKKNSSNLYIQTGLSSPTTTTTLASLSPTTTKRQHKRQYSSSSSSEEEEEEEEEDHDPITPTSSFSRTKRRLSVADLCNPINEKQPQIYLTKDEFEALEGFGRLNYSTEDLFNYSLRDLASNAHILH